MAAAGLTRFSTSLADLSWNSSLFYKLGGQAGAQAGAPSGVQGAYGSHLGGIMTQLTSTSEVLSCCVQLRADCTVFKPLMGHQQEQEQQQQQ